MSEEVKHTVGALRGGRISLTAFEAQWLYMVISTCTDIAADTLEDVDVELLPKKPIENAYEAWDVIVEKLLPITPDVEVYRAALSQGDTP